MTSRWKLLRWSGPVFGVAIAVCLSLPALAHHILGIPHYSYDESYPQAPVIKYAVEAGPHIVELTGYPGRPKPNERTEMHAYFKPRDNGSPTFGKPLNVRVVAGTHITEDLGGTNVFGPETIEPEDNLYIFHPTYPNDGEYTVKLSFEAEGQPVTISFPLTVGDPPSHWSAVLWTLGSMLVIFVVVRAIAIKRRRRLKQEANKSHEPAIHPA